MFEPNGLSWVVLLNLIQPSDYLINLITEQHLGLSDHLYLVNTAVSLTGP